MANITVQDRAKLKHLATNLIGEKRQTVEATNYELARALETFEGVLGDASAVRMSARRAFEAMEARGRKVKTLQFVLNGALDTTSSWWMPAAAREVEARSTFVLFGGSRRDYAGETVLAANEGVTAIISRWGAGYMVAAYLTM